MQVSVNTHNRQEDNHMKILVINIPCNSPAPDRNPQDPTTCTSPCGRVHSVCRDVTYVTAKESDGSCYRQL